MSILNVSHFLGRGQSKREFHKEFIHNFMEPMCGIYWILFIKLGRRHRSGGELEVPLEGGRARW